MGLRELKKKQTRKAISNMATQLFIERGYNNVTTAEIAERAQVSVPTLFNYFPTKESLVFDEDKEMEQDLLNAVLNRQRGQSITDALLEMGLASIESISREQRKQYATFMKLIESTPELSLYSKQMWMRHEKALAQLIKKESKKKMAPIEAEAVAHFVLDSFYRAMGEKNPTTALKSLFKILKEGMKI
ncbi:TetR/AcrR family transcriptional regulator [Bdellovibrio sp. HCB274]|uniref:TetR/AcrR family transcriptional regulator n=1 Tax=Bdellovibrio sp. HCB274 TaxID=3394361 RepID=UPI0039B684CC